MTFDNLVGRTLVEATRTDNSLLFRDTDGRKYSMHHSQDCCESVRIETLDGDLSDLVGAPILYAYEARSIDSPVPPPEMTPDKRDAVETMLKDVECSRGEESETWTFYRLGTVKGAVFIRWYGTSSGYYSEGVDFESVTSEQE